MRLLVLIHLSQINLNKLAKAAVSADQAMAIDFIRALFPEILGFVDQASHC